MNLFDNHNVKPGGSCVTGINMNISQTSIYIGSDARVTYWSR